MQRVLFFAEHHDERHRRGRHSTTKINMKTTQNQNTERGDVRSIDCSADVLILVRLENLFSKEQLAQSGGSETDMVLGCFDNLHDLVANAESITLHEVTLDWGGKWTVHDITRRLPDKEFDSEEQARKWIAHLFEWQPDSRPTIIPPNNPSEPSGQK